MSDPTIQSRLDDAAREIERLASECAAQRAELVRMREELCLAGARLATAEEDRYDLANSLSLAKCEVEAKGGELGRLRAELRTLRDARRNGNEPSLKHHEWPEYRAESKET